MPKNQPVRIIDSRRSPATGGGGSGVVLPGHTHDDRYVLLTNYTAADVLAKLLTVDGPGSGLDADTVDGSHASDFATAAHGHDHGDLTGLSDDDHAQYLLATGTRTGATSQAQTFTAGVIDSSLTASRLLASNGSKQLASVANLADWIAGTANRVSVASDGDGSVTLSLPQNIHTAATPTFAGLIAAYLRPAANSTTALQLQGAGGGAVVTVDTTNARVGIGVSAPEGRLHILTASAGNMTAAANADDLIVENSAQTGISILSAPTNTGNIYFGNPNDNNEGKIIYEHGALANQGTMSFNTASNPPSLFLDSGLNVGISQTIFGTSAAKVLAIANGTAPSTSPADATQLYSADLAAGDAGLHIRSETGAIYKFGSYAVIPGVIRPAADSTTALQLATAGGTGIVIVDTTNSIVTVKNSLIVNEDGVAAGDLRAESDTETNMLFLDASDDVLYLGGSTVGVKVAKGGDVTFLGDGSGLPYGSCYGNEIDWAQASAAQNTWYEVSDADMADGELNLVTHDGSGKLTVAVAGRYLINYTCSAEVSLSGKHVQSGISVSGTESAAGISHYNAVTANEQFNVSGTAILDLAANATIEISLRTTDTGTPNLAVDHLNITVVMVGGS